MSKKRVNGAWVSDSPRIYNTSTDTITTLPQQIIGDGQPITSYTIKGNMSQSGTPTPSAPIYPTECGDLETTGEHAGQYKIPILSGNTTTNEYLGQVQSTRNIKKLVLTGGENWYFSTYPYINGFLTNFPNYLRQKINTCVCSHLQTSTNVQSGEPVVSDTCCFNVESPEGVFYYKDTSVSDLASFKSWLQQQYSAGTPVTLWYVLAEPTTDILNEPIRKIGDYSDSISVTGIPTTGSAESFDIDTTLKPSEVDLTYHGWHEHQDTVFSE